MRLANSVAPGKTVLKDAFWTPYQKLVTEVVLPYQEKILNDEIPNAEKSHALANFRIAAGAEDGAFYGMVFQDSDVAKWLEAASYSLTVHPDPQLEQRVDEVIALVAKAQQPDGYLDTYFTIKEPEHRWMDLLEGHELYCMGHMMEAAAAHYEATGKETLLDVARRMADHIQSVFGPDRRYGIPGHEEVEIGLMRLYQATGEKKYLEMASYFIDARGTRPEFFADERKNRDFEVFGMDPENLDYNQSFAPVREQKSARGHAVRAVYLYRAMAEVAAADGDESLYRACRTLWRDIVDRKMYVTGAIGACGELESFSVDYDLPPDRAYAETCAQVGLVFWARAMLNIEAKGEYADVMELCLYNSTISGMQMDGRHFFYVNPLEVNPGLSGEVFGMRHVLPERPGWYACACCPPNLARMILSLGQSCWSENADTVYSHLMIGQEADLALAKIRVESGYPWDGAVTYTVSPKEKKEFCFAVHIPGYVAPGELTVKCNGAALPVQIAQKASGVSADRADAAAVLCDGYLYLNRSWKDGDTVSLEFPLQVRRLYGTVRVRDTAGQTALMRGPVVYCFEGADNGPYLQALRLPRGAAVTEQRETDGVLSGCVSLRMNGLREADSASLYSAEPPACEETELKAIPYYLWGNRGRNQMRVWIRE